MGSLVDDKLPAAEPTFTLPNGALSAHHHWMFDVPEPLASSRLCVSFSSSTSVLGSHGSGSRVRFPHRSRAAGFVFIRVNPWFNPSARFLPSVHNWTFVFSGRFLIHHWKFEVGRSKFAFFGSWKFDVRP
jgi:hypothetical protein